jgi:hypothetical protein
MSTAAMKPIAPQLPCLHPLSPAEKRRWMLVGIVVVLLATVVNCGPWAPSPPPRHPSPTLVF